MRERPLNTGFPDFILRARFFSSGKPGHDITCFIGISTPESRIRFAGIPDFFPVFRIPIFHTGARRDKSFVKAFETDLHADSISALFILLCLYFHVF